MFSKPLLTAFAFAAVLAGLPASLAFPSHGSLAGMSESQLRDIIPRLVAADPPPPPGPLAFNGTKLVDVPAYPWIAARPGDIRGPCPALNTLASHGYLPRSGVATPVQIINAAQEGLNMENGIAVFVVYAAMLVDGNLVTNLISIGEKTAATGPDPGSPAIVGGMSTHNVGPEGDGSLTRGDKYFGDNTSFNQTLFDQFIDFSNRYGDGYYNLTVAAELRWARLQDSMTRNPTFSFVSPRYFTAYAESALIINAFVDGRSTEKKVDIATATSFFKNTRFPKGFHRAAQPCGSEGAAAIFAAHPIAPGANVDGVNTYTADPTSANLAQFCLLYTNFIQNTVLALYPNPTGVLRRNLILNLGYFYLGSPSVAGCQQLFPYGTLE